MQTLYDKHNEYIGEGADTVSFLSELTCGLGSLASSFRKLIQVHIAGDFIKIVTLHWRLFLGGS